MRRYSVHWLKENWSSLLREHCLLAKKKQLYKSIFQWFQWNFKLLHQIQYKNFSINYVLYCKDYIKLNSEFVSTGCLVDDVVENPKQFKNIVLFFLNTKLNYILQGSPIKQKNLFLVVKNTFKIALNEPKIGKKVNFFHGLKNPLMV